MIYFVSGKMARRTNNGSFGQLGGVLGITLVPPVKSRPDWIPGPLSVPEIPASPDFGISGPESQEARWWWSNSGIYSQNSNFYFMYGVVHQCLDMDANKYQLGIACQCVASDNADILPRNVAKIHSDHLVTLQFNSYPHCKCKCMECTYSTKLEIGTWMHKYILYIQLDVITSSQCWFN